MLNCLNIYNKMKLKNNGVPYRGLADEHLIDAIEQLKNKYQDSESTPIIKVFCNQETLNKLREQGVPEEYLKLAILNYNELC